VEPIDVLVVGAGPTGLALAAALATAGIRPRVVDRALDRAHESRALAIQPRTLEVLAGLGVTPELVAAGNRGVRLRLHAGRREVAIPLFDLGLSDTAYPYLLFLSQAETERILLEHLDRLGVVVERGVELVGLTPGPDECAATLRHGDGRDEGVRARFVVGCDGGHSTVRGEAGIAFEGGSYPQSFVLADLEVDRLTPDSAHAFLAERGLVFFFPLRHPASWRLLAMRPPDAPVSEDVTLDGLQGLIDEYAGAGPRLRLHDPVWMTNFRLHHRAAAAYRSGRVFLAGDSAHIHSPVGAQGMNTGIQDAVNLAWKLAAVLEGTADASIVDTYETERAPVGRGVVRFTDTAFRGVTSDSRLVRLARTVIAPRLVPLAARFRTGRRIAFRTMSQLGIAYRDSPLSVEGPGAPRRGPRAGDRVPDRPIVHNGVSTTVHAALGGPGWRLVRSGPPGAWAPSDLPVLALEPGGPPVQYLVRPDGYIGFRSGPAGEASLRAYRNRWIRRM
jgi:2-polyprenyl-6-methoxyphenol hydroxylase-like FAD-dependent oxidoreductase